MRFRPPGPDHRGAAGAAEAAEDPYETEYSRLFSGGGGQRPTYETETAHIDGTSGGPDDENEYRSQAEFENLPKQQQQRFELVAHPGDRAQPFGYPLRFTRDGDWRSTAAASEVSPEEEVRRFVEQERQMQAQRGSNSGGGGGGEPGGAELSPEEDILRMVVNRSRVNFHQARDAAAAAAVEPPQPIVYPSTTTSATRPEAPPSFFCPITLEVMRDPVTAADGHSYEKDAIEVWLCENNTSPKTGGALLSTTIVPSHALRNAIEEWEASHLMKISRGSLELEAEPIGAGSFKRVYRAQMSLPGAPRPITVAVLVMRLGSCNTEATTFLKLGRHPHLVKFYGQCVDGDDQMLVTEFAPKGSLSDAMEEIETSITAAHRVAMLQQICSGMTAIAEIGMVHRDLAIRNVLLLSYDPANVGVTCVKVCDFGLSVSTYGKSHRTVNGDTLPVLYMPPESLKKRRYSEKSDVWAFGVTAWELLSDGDIPYVDQLGANPEAGILAYIVGGGRLSQPDGCSDSLWAVVQSCWAKNPMDRPTFTELGVELGRL